MRRERREEREERRESVSGDEAEAEGRKCGRQSCRRLLPTSRIARWDSLVDGRQGTAKQSSAIAHRLFGARVEATSESEL